MISEQNPYDHFRSDGCRIFPDLPMPARNVPLQLTAAQRREDMLARRQLRRQEGLARAHDDVRHIEREAGADGLMKRCPFCGARNRKDGRSNHHRCESCAGAFCFLCMADLRRGMRGHFRPAHPQHS